jgi:hypothetical protein
MGDIIPGYHIPEPDDGWSEVYEADQRIEKLLEENAKLKRQIIGLKTLIDAIKEMTDANRSEEAED